MNEKLVERLIGCVPFDVEDSRTIQEAATALTAAQARIKVLETAPDEHGEAALATALRSAIADGVSEGRAQLLVRSVYGETSSSKGYIDED